MGKPGGAISGLFWSLKKKKKQYDRNKKMQAKPVRTITGVK